MGKIKQIEDLQAALDAIADKGSIDISDTDSPYTVLTTIRIMYLDATSGAIILNLPTVTGNHDLIYDIKVVAGSNTITIDPSGAETIDGSATNAFSGVNNARTIRAKGTGSNQGWYNL